ncbi:putative fructokinase [Medicago truncatula]|uniref:Putative fructokinase n=1 Tax=Medicago truncatula TaxID=3880 RepID=A0A396H0Q1_MEDTR|nr:putative fructokinase [Medicago truncatula]
MTGCCFHVTFDRLHRGSLRRLTSSSSLGSSKHGRKICKGPLVVCFGEMMINLVPTIDGVSLSDAEAYKKSPAGATAIVSVAISRLGGSSAFIGKVGNDEFGHMLSDILKQNGVDNSGLLFDEHARTALAFHSLKNSDDGKPEFMFYRNPSADILFRSEEIDKSLIKKVIVISCIKSI